MSCKTCDGNGITFGPGNPNGSIVICPDIHCAAGQRIAKVLTAIGRGEPVGMRNASLAKDGAEYDASCHMLLEPGHRMTEDEKARLHAPGVFHSTALNDAPLRVKEDRS